MQMNYIEKSILSTVHSLPLEKQQEILDFSLFLKSNVQKSGKKNRSNFTIALDDFLN